METLTELAQDKTRARKIHDLPRLKNRRMQSCNPDTQLANWNVPIDNNNNNNGDDDDDDDDNRLHSPRQQWQNQR
ncbi:hypothetical protein RUM43_002428 [Polyplax serrata]|uniref:Uncharacterized protein n=1 Tax=Polyplax serrata TaxID=468196 RepID=A0AAN8RVW9_POLSC